MVWSPRLATSDRDAMPGNVHRRDREVSHNAASHLAGLAAGSGSTSAAFGHNQTKGNDH